MIPALRFGVNVPAPLNMRLPKSLMFVDASRGAGSSGEGEEKAHGLVKMVLKV